MKLTLTWGDGEKREEYDVVEFSWSWNHDEAVVRVEYRDGSDDVFTGKRLAVSHAKEIDGRTNDVE